MYPNYHQFDCNCDICIHVLPCKICGEKPNIFCLENWIFGLRVEHIGTGHTINLQYSFITKLEADTIWNRLMQ